MTSTDELGGLAKVFTVELAPDDLVEAQLAAHGIERQQITHVVNSHLHFDHCGRNGPFAHATTLVQRTSGRRRIDRAPRRTSACRSTRSRQGASSSSTAPTTCSATAPSCACRRPVTPPGTSRCSCGSPTAAGADAALLVGDACYLRTMLADGMLPPFAHDADQQRRSYDVLAGTSAPARA